MKPRKSSKPMQPMQARVFADVTTQDPDLLLQNTALVYLM